MPEMQNIELLPGPSSSTVEKFGSPKEFHNSGLTFANILDVYSKFFKKHNQKLENRIGYNNSPTQAYFQSSLSVFVPPEINNGIELEQELIFSIIINQKFLISRCEMILENNTKYSESDADKFIVMMNRLNDLYCQRGLRFITHNDNDFNLTFRIELVWKNILTDSLFEEYLKLLRIGFQEYGNNFNTIEPILHKIEIKGGGLLFPQFL
jgi:hypothetical protein